MPTLQEVTAAHSRRLSEMHRRRDAALGEAALVRDSELRALASAAAAYARFDKAVAAAVDDRTETEYKAAAARDTALARAAEALERRSRAEAAAEKKYRESIASLGATGAADARQKIARDAEALRQKTLDEAREAYAVAMTAAQASYRAAIDDALVDERKAEGGAEQAFAAARRVALASDAAALANAERNLFNALQTIPDARAALDRYRSAVARIRDEAARDEQQLFARFRHELSLIA
jgi:hypothetical protein